jgi:hypothetical protein
MGTLSLYSALNTQTGEVLAKTSARHTSAEFVDFLAQIVMSQPPGRECQFEHSQKITPVLQIAFLKGLRVLT